MAKAIADLKLNDRVIPKDASYGIGTLVGINEKTNEYLIGYKNGDPKFSGSWTNAGGKFPDSCKLSGAIKDYTHYFFAPSNLELHSNESNNEGITVGDKVDVYCTSSGTIATTEETRDSKQTRKGTVIGFHEDGSPLIYIDADAKFSQEIGNAYNSNWIRNIHENFSTVDTARRAFLNGKDGSNKWFKQTKKGKVKKMGTNEKQGFVEMMKGDGVEAGYRIASGQMVKGMKAALLRLLEKQGSGSERLAAFSDLLDTEMGEAIISVLIGVALPNLPMLSDDERVQRLSKEFRVGGMATAGNAAFDVVAEHLLPVITKSLASLPQENAKTRVSEQTTTKTETTEEEHTEQKAEAPKTLTV